MQSISELIRDHCSLIGISLHELARRTDQSPENLFGKLRRDNWSVKQLQQIAEATDSELRIVLLPKMGRKKG